MGADGTPPTKAALVVDDDHVQAHATARLLRLEDFDTVIATDIESAMTALAQHPIHLVLVDMHLGHERGTDLIERIRSEYPALPTILLSGSEPDELETEALRCGAFAILPKPFDLSRLLEIVATIACSE